MNLLLVWGAANNWPLQYYELQIRRQIEFLSSRFHETRNAKKLDTRNCFCFRCWCFIHIWHRLYIFNCRNQKKWYCGSGFRKLVVHCTLYIRKYPELQISQQIKQTSQSLRNSDWKSHIGQKKLFGNSFHERFFSHYPSLGQQIVRKTAFFIKLRNIV